MIKRITLLAVTLILFSCNTGEIKSLKLSDSIDILKSSIDSKIFVDANIQYTDTLFIIKNKNYHSKYPDTTKYFKLVYIDNLDANKTINKPNATNDRRERFEITEMSLHNDTILFNIYNHGFGEGYKFKFVQKNNNWVIASEDNILN